MEIKTKRLIIRNAIFNDYSSFYEIYSDKNTAYFAGIEKLTTYEEAKRLINRLLSDNNVSIFSFLTKGTYKIIGTISLSFLSDRLGIEIGYAIHPSFRKLGLTYEAIESILTYYNQNYYYLYYQAVIKKNNLPSIRLIEKLGFNKVTTVSNDFIFIKNNSAFI